MDEYELEGETNTKKALKELQLYLQNNPKETNKYLDKLRDDNKSLEASTLYRFATEKYSGLPNKNDIFINKKSKYTINSFLKIFLLISLIVLIIAMIISLYAGHNFLSKFTID